MATTPKVLLKRSSVAGRIPDSSDLQYGELAINFADGKLYYKDDSNNIRAFIDSALVQNLVDQIETVAQSQLDSSEVTVLIDSNYINNRLDTTIVNNLINFGAILDSAFITSIIDSAYINARADIDSGDVVNIINNTVNATYLSNSIDSAFVTNIVDSAYIQARDRFRDSDFVRSIVDSSYITIINQTTAGSIAESADVTNIIDSAYIQSRQITVSGSFDSAAISAIITNDVDKTFVDALNINADKLDAFQGAYYLNYNNFTNTPTALSEFTNDTNYLDSTTATQLVDSDYVRARVRTNQDLYTNSTVTFNQINGPTNFIIDPATVGTDSGTVMILGNLQVNGETTTINSTTVTVNDKNIVLADSAQNAAAADGAGITIEGANATLQYSASGDKFVFNKPFEGVYLGFDSDFSAKSTTDLSEGSNLYYTRARVDSAIAASMTDSANTVYVQTTTIVTSTIDSAYINSRISTVDSAQVLNIVDSDYIKTVTGIDAATLGGNDSSYYLDYNNFSNTPTIPTINKATIDALGINADELDGQDGTYYLNYTNFTNTPNVLDSSEVTNIFSETLTTEGIKEIERIMFIHDSDATVFTVSVASKTQGHRYEGQGSSLGYIVNGMESPTIQMVPGNKYRFDQSNGTNANHPILFYYDAAKTTQYTNGITSSGISAGTNGSYIEIEITDATPSVLYYQCQNHGYMGGQVFTMTRNLTGFDTGDLSEGSNLYFTNTRADARADARIAASTTDNLSEGSTNLYYTKTRVDSDIAASLSDSGNTVYVSTTNIISSTVDSAYINNRINSANFLDSAEAIQLIDSAYIKNIIDSSYLLSAEVSLTVQDEGVSLASDASVLNFVGTGVTVTGTGGTKTITIAGGSGGGGGGGGSASGPIVTRFQYTADSNVNVFSGADDAGNTLAYPFHNDDYQVFLNGVLLVDSDDYTGVDSSTLNLISATDSNDTLTIITFASAGAGGAGTVDSDQTIQLIQTIVDSAYIAQKQTVLPAGTLSVTKYIYEADSGQVTFTDSDKFGNVLSILPDNIEVFLNGVLLEDTTDFSATDSSLTLTEPADSGYSLTIIETKGRVHTDRNTLNLVSYEFTADSGQTSFSGNDDNGQALNLTTGISEVFLNGILISEQQDYTLTNTSLTLNLAADSGDLISINNTVSNNVTSVNYREYLFTNFSGRNISGQGMVFGDNSIQVFVNGSLLSQSEYTTVGGRTVVLDTSVSLSDTVVVSVYGSGQDKVRIFNFTADSGQTVFSGLDDQGNDLLYAMTNSNLVFLNGIALRDSDDFTMTSNQMITLNQATNIGDELQIVAYGHLHYDSAQSIPLERTQFEYTASASQVNFAGTDDNGTNLTYDPGKIAVYLNGLLLSSSDYTATNGTRVSLAVAADSGDILQVERFLGSSPTPVTSIVDSDFIAARVTATGVNVQDEGTPLSTTALTLNFVGDAVTATGSGATKTITISGGGGSTDSSAVSALIDSARFNWSEVDSTAETLIIGAKKIVNTKNQAVTLSLPQGTLGDEVRIIDGAGFADSNNITIQSNQKIIASDSDLVIDVSRAAIGLVYYNDSNGWILIEN